ncbi:MAG: VOC family protein, partial [Actinomycetota bacterium]|nr:VOC family protein [Actinomycetota bacterium]
MFADTAAFSGFSVDDVTEAKRFYGDVLGLDVS